METTWEMPKEYGLGALSLPEGWTGAGRLEPNPRPVPADPAAALRAALREPFDTVPLGERDLSDRRIALVVGAVRPDPLAAMLPTVLAELLSAGARWENLTILMPPRGAAEVDASLLAGGGPLPGGPSMGGFLPRSLKAHADYGRTSSGLPVTLDRRAAGADLTVLLSFIEPHPALGFSGGLETVVPDRAGEETLSGLYLPLPPERRNAFAGRVGEECPARLALEDAAFRAPTEYFLADAVLDGSGRPAGFFCGRPIDAHREGCALARAIWGVPLPPEETDILITGSAPAGPDFPSALRCLSLGAPAVREGGLTIALLSETVEFQRIPRVLSPMDYPRSRKFVRTHGTEPYLRAQSRDADRPLSAEETLLVQELAERLRRTDLFVLAPNLPEGAEKRLGLLRLFRDPKELLAEAARLIPRGRVLLSPLGGACLPLPRAGD